MNETTPASQPAPQAPTPPAPQAQPQRIVVTPKGGKKKFFVVLGILFVLILLAVMYMLFSPTPQPPPMIEKKVAVTTTPLFLTIEHPKDQESAINGELLVSGKTLPNTTVIIFTDSDETSVESDSQGMFEETVLLNTGENMVTITAYAENGDEKTQTLSISSE